MTMPPVTQHNAEAVIKTVVMFVSSSSSRAPPPDGRSWKNALSSRSLRKLAFIDNRFPQTDRDYPRPQEHWLVDIVRENQASAGGGCLILRPIRRVEMEEQTPLVHGMYELSMVDDAVILTPHDQNKCWVMSPAAKQSILDASPNARAIVINHGGAMWTKRRPAESVLEDEARRLLEGDR